MQTIDKIRQETLKKAWQENKAKFSSELTRIDKDNSAGSVGFAWCAALAHLQQIGLLDEREAAYARDYAAAVTNLLAGKEI